MMNQIISVDFDGTLCEHRFPDIGAPNDALIDWLRGMKMLGAKIILNTMREGQYLDEAVKWCAKHKLVFDAVNDNLPEVQAEWNNNPRKIFANIYIDDRNAPDHMLKRLRVPYLKNDPLRGDDNV